MSNFANLTPSSLPENEFIEAFANVFEHSAWIPTKAWQERISSKHDEIDALHALFTSVVDNAEEDKRQQLIDNHPALAAPVPTDDASASSRSEQARAGLESLDKEQVLRFKELNDLYKQKFGIVFILAVEGLQSADILKAFENRLANGNTQDERAEALKQIIKIARLRMGKM